MRMQLEQRLKQFREFANQPNIYATCLDDILCGTVAKYKIWCLIPFFFFSSDYGMSFSFEKYFPIFRHSITFQFSYCPNENVFECRRRDTSWTCSFFSVFHRLSPKQNQQRRKMFVWLCWFMIGFCWCFYFSSVMCECVCVCVRNTLDGCIDLFIYNRDIDLLCGSCRCMIGLPFRINVVCLIPVRLLNFNIV